MGHNKFFIASNMFFFCVIRAADFCKNIFEAEMVLFTLDACYLLAVQLLRASFPHFLYLSLKHCHNQLLRIRWFKTDHNDLLIPSSAHSLRVDGQHPQYPARMVHGKPEDNICPCSIPQAHHLLHPEMIKNCDQVQPNGLKVYCKYINGASAPITSMPGKT